MIDFDRHGVSVASLTGAPGAGKSALLERMLRDFGGVRASVVRDLRSALFPVDAIDLVLLEDHAAQTSVDARVLVASITDGEDQPLQDLGECELVVLNKIDLLGDVDFDLDRWAERLQGVHTMATSARTGAGVDGLRDWLAALPERRLITAALWGRT